MAKTAKTAIQAKTGLFEKIRGFKSRFRQLCDLVRIAKIVLAHVEACLSDLADLDDDPLGPPQITASED